mgnify:CR=1 FL=1
MRSAAVIVASTRAAAGVYQDRSGRIAADWFGSHGFEVEGPFVVADGEDVHEATQRRAQVADRRVHSRADVDDEPAPADRGAHERVGAADRLDHPGDLVGLLSLDDVDHLLTETAGDDLPEDGSIDVVSQTGFRRRLPQRDAGSLLLATREVPTRKAWIANPPRHGVNKNPFGRCRRVSAGLSAGGDAWEAVGQADDPASPINFASVGQLTYNGGAVVAMISPAPSAGADRKLSRSMSAASLYALWLTSAPTFDLYAEVLGSLLAPIQPFLEDASVTEVLINGPDLIFVERFGKLERTSAPDST